LAEREAARLTLAEEAWQQALMAADTPAAAPAAASAATGDGNTGASLLRAVDATSALDPAAEDR
ncbi:MAG TPA: hypothetical protein VNN80_03355, partial [Polyangiaceae bacterium]|nr:hypothetical protein [Polyangiaceae bacterium]